ncbi:O-antigen ligase family protein [Cohnella sp. GCM10027633]|uniref:O-antigen ligase family protein n=1 Tax=unclassified Cohnella TaxID=2636738 RepID=UPI00363ABD38
MIDSSLTSTRSPLLRVHQAVIAFYAVAPFLYLLKPMQGSTAVSVLLRMMEPLLIVIAGGILLVQIVRSGKIKIDIYIVIFLFLMMYGFFTGIFMGNEISSVFSGFSHLLAGILLYWYNKNCNLEQGDIEYFVVKLIKYAVYANTIVILLMYAVNKLIGPTYYIGLDASIYLLALYWWLDRKKLLMMPFVLAMIFLSGKRGVLVVSMFGYWLSWLTLSVSRARLYVKLILVGIVLLIGLQVSGVDLSQTKAYQKIEAIRSLSIAEYSSERIAEVKSAWKGWVESPTEVLFGSGLGFSYTFYYDDPKITPEENYHNIHFSPLNVLVIWGLPLSIVAFLLLAYQMWRIRGRFTGLDGVMRLTAYSYFLYSIFVFNLFNEPVLWTFVGLLLNPASRKEFVRRVG